MNRFDCFEVSVELVENNRGMNLHTLFLADSEAEAIKCGVAWAKNRSQNLKQEIGAVSVCHYSISKPEPSGYIPLRRGFDIFEWKRDFPASLDEYADHAQAKRVVQETRKD